MKVIEVSKLMKLITHLKLPDVEQGTFPIAYYQQYALDNIKEILTEESMVTEIDIVRCKDCKYFENHCDCVKHSADILGYVIEVTDDDYCSYGERREE